MKIGIIGAGRLGICFALLCEKAGYDVLVSDINSEYINNLNNKKIITNEPEVENLLINSKNLVATTDNKKVIEECDLIYTLVATPSLSDGSYDVSSIWDVVKELKKYLDESTNTKAQKYFVVGSTTNPGDCSSFQEYLLPSVDVMYSPEFIAQGSIIKDLENADMVLLGTGPQQSDIMVEQIKELYQKIQKNSVKFYSMSTMSAEITKIAVNCFLTTKISYANMLGDVLTKSGSGSEVDHVLSAIGADTRVGSKYLSYGLGYGGPCLPRDNLAFAHFVDSLGMEYNLGYVTDGFNKEHASTVADFWATQNKENKPFFFEYISYKKGTDIITESQQYQLCLDLLEKGFKTYVLDDPMVTPQVSDFLNEKYGENVVFVDSESNIKEDYIKVKL